MANTVVGAEVQIEYKSIGDLRKAIKEATSDLIVLQEKFGVTSKEAMAAANKVAGLKDRIKDAREQTDRFDPGKKFQGLVSATKIIATGFQAVTSGMALLGVESNKLQETMLKVQAAMAFSQAISQLGDLQEDFDNVKVTATRAFNAIKAAIGSTGIGLLVIALGAIAANWDKIKGAISGVSSAQKKLNEDTAKNLETQKKKLTALDKQENTLRLQGMSEQDILKLKIAQTKQAVQAAVASVKNAKITKDAQVAAATRNKNILAGIINFLSAPLALILKTVGKIGEFLGKDWSFDLGQTLANVIFDPAEVSKEGDAAIANAEATLQDLISQQDGYQLQLLNLNKKANDKANSANDAHNKETQDQNDEAAKAAQEAQKRAEEELAKTKMTAKEIELADLKKKYEEQKAIIEKGGADTTALEKLYEKQKSDIKEKYRKIEEEEQIKYQNIVAELVKRKQKEVVLSEEQIAINAIRDRYKKEREELMKQYPQNIALKILLKQNEQKEIDKVTEQFKQKKLKDDAAEKLNDASNQELSFKDRINKLIEREKIINQITYESAKEKENILKANKDAIIKIQEEEKKHRLEVEQAKLQAVSQGLGAMSNLIGVFADKNEKDNKKIFEIQKALNISQAIIDTYTAANAIMKNAAINPTSILFPAQPFIAAGVAIAAGLANVVKISQQRYKSNVSEKGTNTSTLSGFGGGAAPITPRLGIIATAQTLNAQAINNLGNTALRAYVMNSDIQNTQQQNAYLQRNARIG